MSQKIIISDIEKFENDVLKSELPVVVNFYSEDCQICMAFVPIFERMATKYGEHINFVKVLRQQNRALSDKYNIKTSPTLLFFRNGEEVCSRLNGAVGNREFKEAIESVLGGTCSVKERDKVYCDVLILGGGPAGLSAAIYTSRAKLLTVIVDEGLIGGQVLTTFQVLNYPGSNGVIRGMDLIENMKKQAIDFGTQIDDLKEIQELYLDGEEKHVRTEDTDYYARSIIIATGAEPRKLPAEGEREYRGRGVHYCATCDGALYQDAEVVVIGGGNSAAEEAVFLTRYAKHVTIIHQFDYFQASKVSQDEVLKNANISIIWDSEVRKVIGDNFVKSILIENIKTGEMKELNTEGLFVYIGLTPKTEILKNKIQLSEFGYIITDEDMKTNISGVFAAGDVRNKKIRQIATATGDGVIAGIMSERFINRK
jgi:thioredoxin reductase (NADPH)